MANATRLLNTLARVEQAQHGEWIQVDWCRCFAGHALRDLGYELPDRSRAPEDNVVVGPDGLRRTIREMAIRELDLTESQASRLFLATNSKATLRAIVAELVAFEETFAALLTPELVHA